MIDFSQKSETNFPSTGNGGTAGIFYYRVNGLIKCNKFLEQWENLQGYWSY